MNEELLKLYYDRLFPADLLCKWLDHNSNNSLIRNREFSFTLAGDIYIRYLSFGDSKQLLKEIKRKQPHKIDIGAIYNIEPSKHNGVRASAFVPKERELVFDIDLTDYEEVMGPTQEGVSSIWGKNCNKWKYMSTAMKIVSTVLKEDFGLEKLFWIFSGRRGVHCWVNDEKARLLTDQQRKALMSFFTVLMGKKIEVKFPLHPSIERCIPLLEDCFEHLCETEALFQKKENIEKVLSFITDKEVVSALEEEVENEVDSVKFWKQIKATVVDKAQRLLKKSSISKEGKDLLNSISKILLFFTFPRLDVNVSTHRNHLLKSPFVAHPKTGKICIPILEEQFDSFNPEDVPTLQSLAEELNNTQSKDTKDYERTSLKQYINIFETFISANKDTKPTEKKSVPMEGVEPSSRKRSIEW